ncbi:diacylglycerol kinase family protein [uncultured Kocuria sp.]|uniref:diacylglycerol kinase family protein n=1 Tax=uncultured Kocuria sp. TaxID=259305 RepID=UPI002631749E|nr:diacylglycerol kinase family protein [uncultured Kocuria sp.]
MAEPGPPRGVFVLAVNPCAGRGRALADAHRAAELLRTGGDEAVVLSAGDLTALLELVRDHLRERALTTRALVVVGGDGMVQAGLGVLVELAAQGVDIPLGVVPCGTGNDLARHYRVPLRDPVAAAGRILRRLDDPEPRRLDVGRVRFPDGRTCCFATALCAGFDAVVNERANRWLRLGGSTKYLLAVLVEIVRLRTVRYRLEIEDAGGRCRTERREGVLLNVANTSSIGGGLSIVPGAREDDGLLDLFTVAPLGRARFLFLFPRLFSGRHVALESVRIERVRSVAVDAADVTAYADGERLGPLPVRVDVLPAAVRVLA